VRLLHPDQCPEENTRRLADLQMKRLNAIRSVLMDPESRAAYDCSLLAPPVIAKRPEPVLWWHGPRAGVAAVLLVLLFCAVFPLRPPPLPQIAQARVPAAPPQHVKPSRRNASRGARRSTPVGEEPASEVLPKYHADSPPARTEMPTASSPSPPPLQPALAESAAPQTIAGEWLFVNSASVKKAGYPPEYIELRVSDDHGAIHGRYRARYRVADRAISPNVVFQFEGRTSPEGGVLPWHGAGGSQGEITLHLLADGDLDVEWAANLMGEELGLISGKARLVRKLE
ncbi:MAG: hypothetical protein JWP63_5719, partial [Candidatus Solibacter sp.]|nr:hypothetical protein [Candidatus Solibacter sp.]